MVANIFTFMAGQALDGRLNKLARKMVESGVRPHVFIQRQLDRLAARQLNEGVLGNFFSRLSNAWKAFWKKPGQDPAIHFDDAKEALTALVNMVKDNAQAGGYTLQTILNGLEQSLNILNKVEAPLKQYSNQIVGHQDARKSGKSFTPTILDVKLPPEHQSRLDQILQTFDQINAKPESYEKVTELAAHNEKFRQFLAELEQLYQNQQAGDPTAREEIGEFLRVLEQDSAFREVQRLLNFASQYSAQGYRAKAPERANDVISTYQYITSQFTDPEQVKAAMIKYYTGLMANDPVKEFIREIAQEEGQDEVEVFWNYAQHWAKTKGVSHVNRAFPGQNTQQTQ